ncbi:peptidase U32 family protein [Comamonas odontotermitis]|uniref:peptidase U32 family protein n=1 Tax=Comamonas odontotermitis TaxID=379895 RepID=UPI001CC6FE30|nr:U32 family peptidase [Comamonas odontotermitis]UBB15795.1 U32 family peptidase [Comamonas odontotermitis]
MSLLPHQLELLSPARDADIGIEAVNHGADAVYIGGPAFGARATAGNDIRELERLITHAHRFGSRIFITLNTILRDDELEAARQMAWQIYNAGADALIIQDMGLLELDLPPIQLHASTQSDIRTPEKARFLQDAGLSQIVVARELDLRQIAAVRAATDPARTTIEFFVHGALCVAYSGQCFISHAHTGRSANRGDCNQACRLPYEVLDGSGRIIAHEKHVLSMKDNNQSDNLRALIDAGVRSFKIEGRYKDMGYVKNITAHYRKLLDEIIEEREFSDAPLARSSSGRTTFSFEPDPDQNFNREFTDYFVNGRKDDIGAFDTPKTPGRAIGWVTQVGQAGDKWFELEVSDKTAVLHNGDGLCYYDLQKELVGVHINRAECVNAKKGIWRVFPKNEIAEFKDLRKGLEINRNRDMDWIRTLDKKSSDRRIGLWAELRETADGFALQLTDEDGFTGSATIAQVHQTATDTVKAEISLREQLGRFGATVFAVHDISLQLSQPWFVPASALNQLRRDAVAALEEARAKGFVRLPRAEPVEPPAPFPEDTLTYLANVFNHKAHDFYVKHGVKVIDAAYESKEEEGEVSLMITKHCVRFSMSLCPKQAKGVIGVKGTIKAEPLQLINGKEKLTLRFDCKPCEMHVVGKMKKSVMNQHFKEMQEFPMQFYRTRPAVVQS